MLMHDTDRSTKVLFVLFDVIPGPTGASSRAIELLRGVTPFYEVDILSLKEGELGHVETFYGARLFRVSTLDTDMIKKISAFGRALKRQIESEEYDIVHVHDSFGGQIVCHEKGYHNFAVLYEADGFPSIEYPYVHPSISRNEKLISRWAQEEKICLDQSDVVLTASQTTRKFILSLGVSTDKIVLLSGCVDTDDFKPVDGQRKERDDGPIEILYVGSFTTWQGLDTLLTAVKECRTRMPLRLKLVCPDDATSRRAMKRRLSDLGISDLTNFAGPVDYDKLPAVISASTVAVAPLERCERNVKQGGCPSKIIEYMACARPVVASRLPMTEEIIKDGEDGVLVEPGNAFELSKAILKLAADRGLRQKMSDAALAKVKRLYSANKVRKRLLGIYQGVAGGKVLVSPAVWVEADMPLSVPPPLRREVTGSRRYAAEAKTGPVVPHHGARCQPSASTAKVARKHTSKGEHSTTEIIMRPKSEKKQTPTQKLPANPAAGDIEKAKKSENQSST